MLGGGKGRNGPLACPYGWAFFFVWRLRCNQTLQVLVVERLTRSNGGMKTKTQPPQEPTLTATDIPPKELTPGLADSVPNLDVERSRLEAGVAFIDHVREVFVRYQGKR